MARTRRGLKRSRSLRQQLIRESTFSYIVRRQNNKCWYCQIHMGSDCTKEHLHPQVLGGTDFWPRGNLKAACSGCNSAVGHLAVEIKYRLREICLNEGRSEMYHVARSLRRAQAREAFMVGITYKRW